MAEAEEFSGALFKNDKKVKASQPDYRGVCEQGEQEYWISAWIKTSRAGKKYMSLAFQPKEPAFVHGDISNKVAPIVDNCGDDINGDLPF